MDPGPEPTFTSNPSSGVMTIAAMTPDMIINQIKIKKNEKG